MNKITPADLVEIVKIIDSYEKNGVGHDFGGLCFYANTKNSNRSIDCYELIGSLTCGEGYVSPVGYNEIRVKFSKLLSRYFKEGFVEAILIENDMGDDLYKFKNTPEGVKIRRKIRWLIKKT